VTSGATNQRLRVAFDVTPLGRGRFYPRGRTGLFRVASELAVALHRALGENLVFLAKECRAEAEEVLREAGLTQANVLRSNLDRALYPLLRELSVTARVNESGNMSERRRKTFRTFVRTLEWLGGTPRVRAGSIDLVHSAFLPVSSVDIEDVRSMVTVNDLLALTRPEYFGESDRENARRVVQDVKLGAWAHCISKATRADLLSLVPSAEARSFVAPLAANPQHFRVPEPEQVTRFRASLGLGTEPYFIAVGTLDPRKNLETACKAFALVLAKYPEARLVLVGAKARNADPLGPVLAEQGGLRGRCIRPGFLPDGELAAAYHGATACLFPSHAEGFGLPILEAMSCSTAIISSDTTSMPEVVGDAGILLSPTDTATWANSMLELLENSDKRSALARRGASRAALFSWDKTAASLLEHYHLLAAGRA
jgi:glycosyltransferase involved in cell wall biosynthesis